jgi:glycosyltransferase involved in cell wall biosynthesis
MFERESIDALPTVTVAVPVLNEERHLAACLESILAQRYPGEMEVLVVDGGSWDSTCAISTAYPVRLLHNARRVQSAGLNIALEAAKGDVFVRVDGHSTIAPDFVERSVQALRSTGAAMVGAGLRPQSGGTWIQRAIAAALVSPVGAGPAPFRLGGPSRFVDTVFLSSFWTAAARELGGYIEDDRLNEDPEFAYRLASRGGIWYEESLDSTYAPRETLLALAGQYYRYGKLRAGTVRQHPRSLAARQLAAPLFLVALVTPRRRTALAAYGLLLGVAASRRLPEDPAAAAGLVLALPCMHIPWSVGFFAGLTRPSRRVR